MTKKTISRVLFLLIMTALIAVCVLACQNTASELKITVECDTTKGTYTLLPPLEEYNEGDEVLLTVQPDIGYRIDTVTANGKVLTPDEGGNYKIVFGKENIAVAIEFAQITYKLSINKGENGSHVSVIIDPNKEDFVETEEITLTVTAHDGYEIESLFINGVRIVPENLEEVYKDAAWSNKNREIPLIYHYTVMRSAINVEINAFKGLVDWENASYSGQGYWNAVDPGILNGFDGVITYLHMGTDGAGRPSAIEYFRCEDVEPGVYQIVSSWNNYYKVLESAKYFSIFNNSMGNLRIKRATVGDTFTVKRTDGQRDVIIGFEETVTESFYMNIVIKRIGDVEDEFEKATPSDFEGIWECKEESTGTKYVCVMTPTNDDKVRVQRYYKPSGGVYFLIDDFVIDELDDRAEWLGYNSNNNYEVFFSHWSATDDAPETVIMDNGMSYTRYPMTRGFTVETDDYVGYWERGDALLEIEQVKPSTGSAYLTGVYDNEEGERTTYTFENVDGVWTDGSVTLKYNYDDFSARTLTLDNNGSKTVFNRSASPIDIDPYLGTWIDKKDNPTWTVKVNSSAVGNKDNRLKVTINDGEEVTFKLNDRGFFEYTDGTDSYALEKGEFISQLFFTKNKERITLTLNAAIDHLHDRFQGKWVSVAGTFHGEPYNAGEYELEVNGSEVTLKRDGIEQEVSRVIQREADDNRFEMREEYVQFDWVMVDEEGNKTDPFKYMFYIRNNDLVITDDFTFAKNEYIRLSKGEINIKDVISNGTYTIGKSGVGNFKGFGSSVTSLELIVANGTIGKLTVNGAVKTVTNIKLNIRMIGDRGNTPEQYVSFECDGTTYYIFKNRDDPNSTTVPREKLYGTGNSGITTSLADPASSWLPLTTKVGNPDGGGGFVPGVPGGSVVG